MAIVPSKTFPSRVYKYVTQARIDVLENLQIRFTQPFGVNDPFELKPLFSQIIPDEMLSKVLDPSSEEMKANLLVSLEKEYKKLPRITRRNVSFKQFLQRIEANPHVIKEGFEKIKPTAYALNKGFAPIAREMLIDNFSQMGILSLCSSLTNPTMWAYYADDYRGLVYEFDASHPFFDRRRSPDDEFLHLRVVHYRNNNNGSRALSDIKIEELCYMKGVNWDHEEEWRIISPLELTANKIGNDIYLFDFPARALMRVIVGFKVDIHFIEKVKTILSNRSDLSHVSLARINRNFEFNCLNVVPIDHPY
jgi:hypothetical protein